MSCESLFTPLDSSRRKKQKDSKSSRKGVYHLAFPKGTCVIRFSDLCNYITNTVWMIENHIMIRKLVLESPLIPGELAKFQMTNRYQGWYYDEPWDFMSLTVRGKSTDGMVSVIFPNRDAIDQAIDNAAVLREKGNQKEESSRIQLEKKVKHIKEIKSKRKKEILDHWNDGIFED